MNKYVRNIILIILFIIFIFSAYKVLKYFVEQNYNKKLNNELIEKVISKHEEVVENEEENKQILPINVDFSVLQQECKDIVAWIYCEGTPINYPIVQSKDNSYYLRRLINGKYNTAGTIFMDFRNNKDLTDNNTIIYGHNMKNDTMFGTLIKYKKQSYYDEHPRIYLFTPNDNYIIELFAGCTISLESDIYNLTKMGQEGINELIEKSDFKTDVTVTEEDRIITLSTCSYEYNDARYVIMGVLHLIQ